ncbi:WD repeat-containing protein 20 [Drosophila sechellia]|uniref:WD repeat-containing protein 20 n=1 Tax=Drosophila sechellia TaxID=7238 RepID=UPI0013DE3537|nr:WD repeat-containing protein 20 [Drosophila sechellia]
MANQLDASVKDDLKTQFVTREGTYRLLTLSEYSRPNRVGYSSNQSSPQVRVSMVTLPSPAQGKLGSDAGVGTPVGGGGAGANTTTTNGSSPGASPTGAAGASTAISNGGAGGDSNYSHSNHNSNSAGTNTVEARLGGGISMHSMMNGGVVDQNGVATNQVLGGDRICFNFGRDLYVYSFRGAKKGTEMSKPIDKKFYKGTNPSCHDFNVSSATPTGAPLLVGFTTGQIQLVSPHVGPREVRKLFNEERLIDKTKVTCLKWLPNSPHLFLAAHASGHLYLYNEELPCAATAPSYQPFKLGDGYTILTSKSKTTRNPLFKWVFSTDNCCVNEFCFSPCGSHLAVVSQDGFLRVFHYDTMELLGIARSYFGGFLCVCWSPDGKYIVVGGEDDLVTVWSLHERRVVARGQGHRSWVSVVAFDPYTTSYTNWDGGDFSDDENQMNEYSHSREARFSGDSTANGGFEGFDRNSTPVHAARNGPHSASFRSDASSAEKLMSYRLGSVSQDTQICLWDITEDVLRHPLVLRQRANSERGYLNGGVDEEAEAEDDIKVIRPVAMSGQATGQQAESGSCSPTRESAGGGTGNGAGEHSNSSSSKFSTANCTISSQSSPDDCDTEAATPASTSSNAGAGSVAGAGAAASTKQNNRNHGTGNSIKFPNCITATKSDSIDGGGGSGSGQRPSQTTSGYNSKTSNSSNKSSNSGSGFSAFNSLTQRLSNFSFLSSSEKKAAGIEGSHSTAHRQHRKAMSMLKSYNQHNHTGGHNNHSQSNNSSSSNFGHSSTLDSNAAGAIGSSSTAHSFGSLKLSRSSHHSSLATAAHASGSGAGSGSGVSSFDPMQLIGTPACPRFDECPLLEPLVCKKIAHERLTALIFREDCFLTACQDGFIYTWARPGHATHATQHLSPGQTAAPGGTVI